MAAVASERAPPASQDAQSGPRALTPGAIPRESLHNIGEFAGRRSPAAEALLAKFEELQAESKGLKEKSLHIRRLQTENDQLRRRLQESERSQEVATESLACSLHSLRGQLSCSGILLADAGSDDACLELHAQLQRGECTLEGEGQALVRRVERVEVLLLADIHGERRCLMERVKGKQGQEPQLLSPPICAVQERESRSEAAGRLLTELFGVDLAWQARYLRLDGEGGDVSDTIRPTPDLPQLKTREMVHTVRYLVRPNGAPEEELPGDEHLECIAIPGGGDFFTKAPGSGSHQVRRSWCWEKLKVDVGSRELSKFEKYLADHGVDVAKFGSGSMKTLLMLYTEVNDLKESYLKEVAPEEDDGGVRLLRVSEILRINLEVEVHGRRRILASTRQFLDDGRAREHKRNLVIKLRPGENWKDALPRAFRERLGLSQETHDECFQLVPGREVHSEELCWSKGYPLRTRYIAHDVTVTVVDPFHDALECMGLPFGHDFVSKEGNLGANQLGRLHVWTWEPAAIDESLQNLFRGTPYEELAKYLHDIQNIVHQTKNQDSFRDLGLDAPLGQVLDKVQKCLDTVVNIDQNLLEVDINSMLAAGRNPSRLGAPEEEPAPRTSTEFVDFISSNYTRKSQRRPSRRPSVNFNFIDPSILADPSERSTSLGDVEAKPWLEKLKKEQKYWSLDLFDLSEVSGNTVLQSYGRVNFLPICRSALYCEKQPVIEFLDVVASLYLDNPYHNSMHAAQVCHASLWLAEATGLTAFQLGLEKAALMIAAICHDVKHFGRNNAFCISTKHNLSLLYNDRSVLENMSSACCFQIMQGDNGKMNLLAALQTEDQAMVRSHIIELILSTDMGEHFELISKFRVRRLADNFRVEEEADRRFVTKMCLKAGDVSHAALPWDVHTRWSTLVTQEFVEQGDEERRLGLPVSPLCDRDKLQDLGKTQKGFLEFVCLPLFEELAGYQAEWQANLALEESLEECPDGQISAVMSGTSSVVGKLSSGLSDVSGKRSMPSGRHTGQASPGSALLSRRHSLSHRKSGLSAGSPLAKELSQKLLKQVDTDIQVACILLLKENADKWVDETEAVNVLIKQLQAPQAGPGATASIGAKST